jgi:arabinofuranosyltransferase
MVRPDIGIDRRTLQAARATLQCGAVKKLIDAESAPLTWSRFFDNLTGAFGRTSLSIPTDPLKAEKKFCHRPGRKFGR